MSDLPFPTPNSPSKLTPTKIDVCIVGGGFAGMNTAILLRKKGIKSEIVTAGSGASQLWAGTVDFLKTDQLNLEDAYQKFQKMLPAHPYSMMSYPDAVFAIQEFFSYVPEIAPFFYEGSLTNQRVLTSLGQLKPCVGIWHTIFHQSDIFTLQSTGVLIDFEEFTSSATYLIAKGMNDQFPGTFLVVKLSLSKIFHITKSLTLLELATLFDTPSKAIELLGQEILISLKQQYPKINPNKIAAYLFPPVLGFKFTDNILNELTVTLKSPCFEMVALSPSVMATRLLNCFEQKLASTKIGVKKGWTLIDLKAIDKIYELTFQNMQQEIYTVQAKYVVIATGSVFPAGSLVDLNKTRELFKSLQISIPNLLKKFQLVGSDPHRQTHIFVCGSSSYVFRGGLSDDDEIKYNTGLGLAIVSSAGVVSEIVREVNGR